MIRGEALDRLLLKLGRPPTQVVMSVADFQAAAASMSCFDAYCYSTRFEGQFTGMVAWADTNRDPAIYLAWEWIQVRESAVGMHDPTALASNIKLIDSAGLEVSTYKRQTITMTAAHGWQWWTTVDPLRLCLKPIL